MREQSKQVGQRLETVSLRKPPPPPPPEGTPNLLIFTGKSGVERNKQAENNRWKEREQCKQVEWVSEWISSRIG